MLTIKIKNIGVPVPFYATKGASGFDICSAENAVVYSGESRIIPTGLFLEIPEGYEVQIRPRRRLTARHNVTVSNSPATIDSDYRGEVGIILMNHSNKPFIIMEGDRIAQGVFAPVIQAQFELVNELSSTERSVGGFGSTGV